VSGCDCMCVCLYMCVFVCFVVSYCVYIESLTIMDVSIGNDLYKRNTLCYFCVLCVFV